MHGCSHDLSTLRSFISCFKHGDSHNLNYAIMVVPFFFQVARNPHPTFPSTATPMASPATFPPPRFLPPQLLPPRTLVPSSETASEALPECTRPQGTSRSRTLPTGTGVRSNSIGTRPPVCLNPRRRCRCLRAGFASCRPWSPRTI